jgi:hypothetical protein
LIAILNTLFQPLAVIEKYDNDSIQEQVNGEYKFSFTTYIDEDGKSEYLVDGNLIEVENQLFNIAHHRRTRSNTGATLVSVDCEQVSYDLLLTEWADGFVHAGTPAQLLEMALAGTGFTVGAVELTGYISVDLAEENVSVRAILMEIAAQSGGEFLFNRYTISLLARRGQPRGVRFSLGKNLRGIIKDVDIRSGERVVGYEIDVLELNSLPEFQGLEYFELGDTVGIDDAELGIDEQQRIISYAYSPRRRINSKVTISKKIPGITDAVVSLRKTTVVKDKVYNGTRIGPEVGFEAVRSDNLARAVMNATEGIKLQKGNGSGSSWTDVIYLDTEGNGIFSGRVIASSFEGGTITIGSGDNAFRASDWGIWLGDEAFADAPFSVNVAGKMKAVDGEFQGKITASDIDGGVITGALIRTAIFGVFPRAEMSDSNNTFTVAASATNRVEMTSTGYPVAGVGFAFTNGSQVSRIAGNNGLYFYGDPSITMEAMNIYLRGYNGAYVSRWSDFRSEETGVSMQSELDSLVSLITSAAINMTFDSTTRNLKLWSMSGSLLAQVNIPK